MRTKRDSIRLVVGIGAAAAVASAASAEHSDLLLLIDGGGNLITGAIDFDSGTVLNTDQRVYEGEFDVLGTTDEPGFNAVSSPPAGFSALPGNEDVNFNALAFDIGGTSSNLWFWDATGGVNFTPMTGGTTHTTSKNPSATFNATLNGSSSSVPGFVVNQTAANGFMHQHLDFTLFDVNTAPSGFYLWSFEVQVDGLTSEPVYFVHGLGEPGEEQHELAVEWVENNVVPTPGTLGALAVVGVAGVRRRRRGA